MGISSGAAQTPGCHDRPSH